ARRWRRRRRTPPTRAGVDGVRRGEGSGRDGLDLEVDLHLVAHQHAAGLERRVPGQAEVLPGDLGAGGEADARGAERVGRGTVELRGELDAARGAADRQVAGDDVVLAVLADVGGDEGPLRVRLDLEEV